MKASIESNEPKQPEKRLYHKQNCKLTQFPVIKLHILQNIQIINLSHNFISDLKSLDTHIHTSHHALSKLRNIDLSFNKLTSVESLIPLALTATNLTQIKITDNPLTYTINFLYEMILIFKKIKEITHTNTLLINNQLRNKIIEFHLKGGNHLSQFLQTIHTLTITHQLSLKETKYIENIQNLIEQLSKQHLSIIQQNQLIFNSIEIFCKLFRYINNKEKSHTYHHSPTNQTYIQTYQQYQIDTNKNSLSRYLSSPDEQLINTHKTISQQWMHYYYQQMINNPQIQNKLLFQIEVSQQQNQEIQQGKFSIDNSIFSSIITHKWRSHSKLTYLQYPELYNTQNIHSKISPFKSIHTQTSTHRTTSRINNNHSLNNYFFGFDREWTSTTNKFIIHRLLSLIKTTIQTSRKQSIKNPQNLKIHLQQNEQPHQISNFNSKNIQNQLKYHTFGTINNQQHQFYRSPKPKQFDKCSSSDDSLDYQTKRQYHSQYSLKSSLSPKSSNKYIIGPCTKILQQIIKKIIFRKLCSTTLIKYHEIYTFQQTILKIQKHLKQISFRKIFQESFFIKCVTNTLQKKKITRIFTEWKKIKKIKLKLLKKIINRKHKKQTAFLSVFITQWRIIGRNIKMKQILTQKQQQLDIKDSPLAEISIIMARSETKLNLNSKPTRIFSKITERKKI